MKEQKFICKYCGKICKNHNSLRNHERLCKQNPNHQAHTGFIYGWNKGLHKSKNLKIESTKNFIPYYCKKCGKLVTTNYGSGKFCSKSCACSRNFSITTRLKKREALYQYYKNKGNVKHLSENKICPICGKNYYGHTKTCSKICGYKYRSQTYKVSIETKQKIAKRMQDNVKKGLHKGWLTRNVESYPEKFFKKVLKNNNIEYEFNKPITKKSLGINECGCYFLDFALKNKLVLEIDGKQHLLPERKQHDIMRDNYLNKAGWKVYRILWKTLPKYNDYMKEEINKFLNWYNKNI